MEIKNEGGLETGYNSLLSLRASSPGRSIGGREKERELATASLEFEFHLQFPWAPCRLSCQISANQGEAETSANVNKHWKTRAKGNDVITNVTSANWHFAATFSMQIFKIQWRSCKLFFLFPPRRQSAPERLALRLLVALRIEHVLWKRINVFLPYSNKTLVCILLHLGKWLWLYMGIITGNGFHQNSLALQLGILCLSETRKLHYVSVAHIIRNRKCTSPLW